MKKVLVVLVLGIVVLVSGCTKSNPYKECPEGTTLIYDEWCLGNNYRLKEVEGTIILFWEEQKCHNEIFDELMGYNYVDIHYLEPVKQGTEIEVIDCDLCKKDIELKSTETRICIENPYENPTVNVTIKGVFNVTDLWGSQGIVNERT